tara:strand:+ start:13246 stop:14559 length:1314 start_codon:yes stop_codon:yes gene_type:complete
MTNKKKEFKTYIRAHTPAELATYMHRIYNVNYEQNVKMLENIFEIDRNSYIKKDVQLKQIGKGGFNTVYSTNLFWRNSPIILRMSTDPLSAKELRERIAEVKFNLKVNNKNPGKLTEFTYFATSFMSHTAHGFAFELKEGFDMDLKTYLKKNVPVSKKVRALTDAINCMKALNKMGLYCFDVKPGNFLVNVNRRPVHYKGKSKKVYVRITDLGADFCTETDLRFTKHSKRAFETITQIQLLLMADAKWTQIVAEKIGLCDAKRMKELRDTLLDLSKEKNSSGVDWVEVYRVFDHYVGLPYTFVTQNLDYDKFEKNELSEICSPRPKSPRNRSPRNRSRTPKRKRKRKKSRKSKSCNQALKRSGKWCNRKTGRWNKVKRKTRARSRTVRRRVCSPRKTVRCRDKLKRSDKICNPKTGRWVLKKGRIGQTILNLFGRCN